MNESSITPKSIDSQVLVFDIARRWTVFPCKPDKTPYIKGGFHSATQEPEQIREWWERWPGALIGIPCAQNGIFAVDIDRKNGVDGLQAFDELRLIHGQGQDIPIGPIQKTPSGGYHLIFRLPEGLTIPNNAGKLAPGLDLRSNGYICAGAGYTWQPDHGYDATLTDAPTWLLDLIRNLEKTPTQTQAERPQAKNNGDPGGYWLNHYLDIATPGNRNENGFALACQLRDSGLSELEAAPIMARYQAGVPGGGYTLPEAMASLKSAYSGQAREPAHIPGITVSKNGRGAAYQETESNIPDIPDIPDNFSFENPQGGVQGDYPQTDAGNAETMAALYGEKLRYDHRRAKWCFWTGTRWEQDKNGTIDRLAIATVRKRLEAAIDIEDQDRRIRAVKWALGSENRSRLNALISVAQSLHPITDSGGNWDINPWLVGCNNGVIDLRTGDLRPGKPTDKITLSTGIDYDPGAQCPRFDRFLLEVFDNDLELIDFVQRAAGYSLTADTREHVLFLCWGKGANGKSTLLNALRAAMGDYATNTPFSTFELNQSNQTNDVAALYGLRFVTASETSESRRLNEARVKAITGGDPVTARFLFGEYFTYQPTYKVWLAMNHKPTITGTDEGIWRRIRLIPFTVSFKGREDKSLAETLKSELPGILAWAIEGAIKWQAGGLTEPKAVLAATEQYRQESDIIGQFLAECTIEQPGASVKGGDLYAAYVAWCKENGEREMSGTAFGRRIKERGIDSVRKIHVIYLNISLLSQDSLDS